MLDLTTFEFEARDVRVIMQGDDPWFVAADVCAVLGIGNPSDAIARLDDDERATVNMKDVGISEGIRGNHYSPAAKGVDFNRLPFDIEGMTLGNTEGHSSRGGARSLNIISESGLYTIILRSHGATIPGTVQHRFRKWVTAEVLPAIRRTGRYEMPQRSSLDSLPREDVGNWLSLIREARILRGREVAAAMWEQSPLPPLLDAGNLSQDQSFGSVEEFLAECVVVTGHQHEFVRASTLIDAFWRWQDARDETRTGLRTVSNAFARLAGVWRCPATGKRFSKAKRSTSGYRGIRLVGPQDMRPR